MSGYRSSSSGFTDYSSDISFDEESADEDISDEIFDEYTERNMEWLVPCTAAEHRTCQIVDHLPALNKLLRSIGLRLRELSEGDGQLAVVDSRTDFISWLKESGKENFRFLAWLLNSHRCVTSLYLNDISLLPFLKEDPRGVLDGNTSLNPLNVGSRSSICDIIPKLTQLEKFEVLEYDLGPDIVEALSQVLCSKNLSALKVFCYGRNGDKEVDALLAALKASATLRELSVNAGLFSGSPGRGKITFMEYLENNKVLERLNIYGNEHDFMKCVLMAMCRNRSVSELCLYGDCFDFGTYLLLRDLLLENAVLKRFTMSAIDGRHALSHEEGFEEWLEALGKNRGLRYISFPFAMIPHGRWGSLFETVSTHTSLKEVVVEVSGWQQCEEVRDSQYKKVQNFKPYELEDVLHGALLDVCKILENSGAKDKVTFTFVALQSHPLVEADRRRHAFPFPVFPGAMTSPSMDLLKQLCSFDSCRMTELKVELSCLQGHSSGIAQFIKETTTLKRLFLSNRLDQNMPSIDSIWSNILESLSQNTSIIEVILHAIMESAESLRHFAKVVKSSTTIRTLKISLHEARRFTYCRADSPIDISKNYSLCSFSILDRLPRQAIHTLDWLDWYNTSWRNSGIVARAARFVKSTMCDRLPSFGPLRPQPSLAVRVSSSRTVSTRRNKNFKYFKLAKASTAQFCYYRLRWPSTLLSPGRKGQSVRRRPRIYKYRLRRTPVWGTSLQGTRSRKCPFSCRRGAGALETLSRHPALVAELAEVLTVTDAEAASLVQAGLNHIQDMHEFMRLAGVVKQGVTCEPREDGCKQLCDLDEDCWRHVMRYLKLNDIRYPSESVDETAHQ